MASSKKDLLKKIYRAKRGCGCGRLKPSDIINPKPKPRITNSRFQKKMPCPSSSSSNWERGDQDREDQTCSSTTTFSLNLETCSYPSEPDDTDPQHCSEMIRISQSQSQSRKLNESIAVVKDSDDPYHDFRQSMLQMILEKQIFSKGDLQNLLDCFLRLNSPCHHDVIIQAFMEIWNGVVVSQTKSP